jgi:chemotaxis protein methyltransferase CheR
LDFDDFLQATLPELGLVPRRHRRRAVRRKIVRRMDSLGLRELEAYRALLCEDPDERRRFADGLGVTITRFFRDRDVLIPALDAVFSSWEEPGAGRDRRERIWCAGAAGGEEPYSLAMAWIVHREASDRPPTPWPEILATDVDEVALERARTAVYEGTSLRELPADLLTRFFRPTGPRSPSKRGPAPHRLRREIRERVRFERRNLLFDPLPPGPFALVSCRNLVFTYFDAARRRDFVRRLETITTPDAALLIGRSESLPPEIAGAFRNPDPALPVLYRRVGRTRRAPS